MGSKINTSTLEMYFTSIWKILGCMIFSRINKEFFFFSKVSLIIFDLTIQKWEIVEEKIHENKTML